MRQMSREPHVGATVPEPPVFATYLEAHDEATHRRAHEAARGFIVEVAKSPYGGYYVRSWPEEVLENPDLRAILQRDEPDYKDI